MMLSLPRSPRIRFRKAPPCDRQQASFQGGGNLQCENLAAMPLIMESKDAPLGICLMVTLLDARDGEMVSGRYEKSENILDNQAEYVKRESGNILSRLFSSDGRWRIKSTAGPLSMRSCARGSHEAIAAKALHLRTLCAISGVSGVTG